MALNNKMTITQVAKKLGVVPKTIMRWEKAGKIPRVKRNWRGWRIYSRGELDEIKSFVNALY